MEPSAVSGSKLLNSAKLLKKNVKGNICNINLTVDIHEDLRHQS